VEYCHWAGAKLGIEDLRSFWNEPLFILGIDDERLLEVLEGSQLRQVLLGGRLICTFILTIYYCKLLHSCQRKYSICYSGIQSSLESPQISMSCNITRDITYYVPTCSPEQPRLMPKENQKMSHEQRVYLIMKIKRIKQIEKQRSVQRDILHCLLNTERRMVIASTIGWGVCLVCSSLGR
jgi:hypothetical protein